MNLDKNYVEFLTRNYTRKKRGELNMYNFERKKNTNLVFYMQRNYLSKDNILIDLKVKCSCKELIITLYFVIFCHRLVK